MRKFLFCLIIFLSIAGQSFAAPCLGTKMPQQKKVFVGLETYSVFNRKLEKEYGKISSFQNFFLLSLGVFDWLSLDLKGGAGNVKQTSEADSKIKYSTYLGGGYGFRARLYEKDKTKMVFGFQHISIHPHTASIGASKEKVVLDDWQFSLLASYEFSKITPYIGTRWSRMDNIKWIDTERDRQKSDLTKSIGLITGADIPINKRIWFNVEGQFFDTTALAASIKFAF